MTLSRNNSTIRLYRPKVGTLCKMAAWEDYSSRGISMWSYLYVIGVDADTVTVRPAPSPQDRSKDGEVITLPLYAIQTPVGWEPRYTIHCKKGMGSTVLEWMARGVVVRQSHDMSGSMPTAFQPLTDGNIPGTPHWQFPEDTDVILPEDCPKVFKIVEVEEEEVPRLGPQPDCHRCAGTGRDTIARLASARKDSADKVRAEVVAGEIPVKGYNAASDTFACMCGLYMSGLGRSKRAKVIKEMEQDGWQVWYVKYAGGMWMRRREVMIKDWE